MPPRSTARPELTPAGRLDEAQLHQVLGYQLAQARIVTDALFADHVGVPFGLRPVEFTVLTLIAENPGGSLARIARALAVTAPNVTVLIDRLEAKGWIERAQSSKDRRSQVLHTTPSGAALVRDTTQRVLQAERQALGLSMAEQAMLVELLHKVACARPAG